METRAGGDVPELQRNSILRDILERVSDFATDFTDLDLDALKSEIVLPVLNNQFDPEVQIRAFHKLFRHTRTYRERLEALGDKELQAKIDAFVGGKSAREVVGEGGFEPRTSRGPGAGRRYSLLGALKRLALCCTQAQTEKDDAGRLADKHYRDVPIIFENRQQTKILSDVPFENWGLSVHNKPKFTCVPTTVLGVINLVKYAEERDLRVRCAGHRHSWSSIFGGDKQILVSFADPATVNNIPDPISLNPESHTGKNVSELQSIELKEFTSGGKRLCRVGAAVTGEDFRRWALANNTHTLPVDVILVEVTMGGVNGSICHSAGINHKTISDYVRRIEYVDVHGKLQTVSDPLQLRAAAGCFGLVGVVTHITYELDPMTYAVMKPRKVDVGLAIPPMSKSDIPWDLAKHSSWLSDPDWAQQLEAAVVNFETRAANDYYSQWFWFTYQQRVWVHTWNTTTDSTGAEDYPGGAGTFIQWLQGWIGGVMTSHPLFNALPGSWQAQLLATSGMAALPPSFGEDEEPTVKTALPNALHFRRGTANMRVHDMELGIPIPEKAGKPDFDVVRRAWWDVIRLVYDYKREDVGNPLDPSCPMRLTLELRIIGGSDILLAPQWGNQWGTAAIEVLSVPDAVDDGEWHGFLDRVADVWIGRGGTVGRRRGQPMVRPHWAKEWEGIKLGGLGAREYLKLAYSDQFGSFKRTLEGMGEAQGWSLRDLAERFSNELWDELIFAMEK